VAYAQIRFRGRGSWLRVSTIARPKVSLLGNSIAGPSHSDHNKNLASGSLSRSRLPAIRSRTTNAPPSGALQWRTESRNVPTEPASTVANTATPQTRKIDPAEEASQGYPDKAMLNMTVAQLKAAPDFTYAPDPAAQTESASQGLEQRSHAQTSVPKP